MLQFEIHNILPQRACLRIHFLRTYTRINDNKFISAISRAKCLPILHLFQLICNCNNALVALLMSIIVIILLEKVNI